MEGSWNPENYLEVISYEKARISSPYILGEIDKFFPKLIEAWKPLFISLGIKEPQVTYEILGEGESDLDSSGYISGYQVNSHLGYFSIDRESLSVIFSAISNAELKSSAEILISYLFRRLLVSLEKTWVGSTKLKVSYLEEGINSKTEIFAILRLNIKLDEREAQIIIGIPIGIIEILINTIPEINRINVSDLTLEFFSVFVPPESLLDYLRNGSVIRSSEPFSSKVNLYANNNPWAQGVVKICQGRYVVEVTSLIFPKQDSSKGNTRISVQLDKIKVSQDLKSHKALGSVIMTDIKLSSPFAVVVSGEKIGTANMSIDENNFPTLKLISKY